MCKKPAYVVSGITLCIFLTIYLNGFSRDHLQRQIYPNRIYNGTLCLYFGGGIGNNMFQYASTYAIAKRKRMKLVIPEKFPLSRIFDLDIDPSSYNPYICRPNTIYVRPEQQCCAYDRELLHFNNNITVQLIWNLASYLYFDAYESAIRSQFVFRKSIQEKAYRVIKDKGIFPANKHTFIGVHVRRGDYVANPKGYTVASNQYLINAMNWFENRFNNIHFVVGSNGIDWCKRNIPKNISVSYLQKNAPEIDMAILSMCNHTISTVGTFSWWTAWLTGGNVTYFKWPAFEGSAMRQHFSRNYSDYFYPTWIGLT